VACSRVIFTPNLKPTVLHRSDFCHVTTSAPQGPPAPQVREQISEGVSGFLVHNPMTMHGGLEAELQLQAFLTHGCEQSAYRPYQFASG
jgi:hypothetical protein